MKKMRIMLMLLTSVILTLIPAIQATAATSPAPPTIAVSGGTVDTNGEISVNVIVNASENTPVGAIAFTLEFDNTILAYQSSRLHLIGAANAAETGHMRVSLASAVPMTASMSVLEVVFQVQNGARGTTQLSLSNISAYDSVGNQIEIGSINAVIQIGSAGVAAPSPVIITLRGMLETNRQQSEHIFVAPVSGVFNFELLGDLGQYKFTLTDMRNQRLNSAFLNVGGFSQYLNAGQSYRILIEQNWGHGQYTVHIQVPFTTTVINNLINGELNHTGQTNAYEFTASRSGYHLFSFQANFDGQFTFQIFDMRGQRINNTFFTNGGLLQYLSDGQQIRIYVKQSHGFMDYNISIHPPAITSISGNTVRGSLDNHYQNNVYSFMPRTAGTFTFDLTGNFPNSSFRTIIYDVDSDRQVASAFVNGNETITVNLEENRLYHIHIRQNRHLLDYNFVIHSS